MKKKLKKMDYFTVGKFEMMSLPWIDVCHYREDERTGRGGGEEKGRTALADEESSTVPPHASTPQDVKRVK